MQRILILSQSGPLVSGLSGELLPCGYQVQACAETGEALAEALYARPPEVLLVQDQHHALAVEEMSAAGNSPAPALLVLVPEGRLRQFDPTPPPDDILVLPGRPGELVARLDMLRWRLRKLPANQKIQVEALQIDLANYRVRLGDTVIELTYKEFELLRFLATHRGRVFTREALLSQVWGSDYFGGTRTVDVHVRRIRAKLGPPYDALVETVRNVGYRFAGPDAIELPL